MSIAIETKEGRMKVILPYEPKMEEFETIKNQVKAESSIKEIVIDLKNCPYVQSKVLAGLIAVRKFVSAVHIKLVLANVQEGVHQLLDIMNLLDHFIIQRDFSSYTPEELSYLFLDPEIGDAVSDYVASNFDGEYKDKVYELLDSEDPIFCEYAIITLGKAHDYDSIDKVKKALDSEYPNVVKAAILVLGWFGDTESKEKIYSFLNNDFIDIAEAAAASIALLADENDSIAIKEYLSSQDERLRKIAVQALGLINDEFGFSFLLEHLKKESNDSLRAFTIKTLSYFNKPEVADILLAALTEKDLKVREAAASSLIRIKAVDKADQILSMVSDSDSWVGYFAVKAVAQLCKSKECSKYLEDAFSKVETHVKIAIIEALGVIGNDVSDFLYQLLEDQNEDIRKESLNSIWKLNKEMADEAAKISAKNDDNWIVRFKAVEILGELKMTGYLDCLKECYEKEENKFVKEKIMSILGEI